MNIAAKPITELEIRGVKAKRYLGETPYEETYFRWFADSLPQTLASNRIQIGELVCWHHEFTFANYEYHDDVEIFCYESGTGLVVFCDLAEDGAPIMETMQAAIVEKGTHLYIEGGKGHFVPIAVSDEPLRCVVVSSADFHTEHRQAPEPVHVTV